MLKKEELIFVKSRLSFWEKLSDVETSILENNITKVTYSKGYNLHSTDSKCLGVLIVQWCITCLHFVRGRS